MKSVLEFVLEFVLKIVRFVCREYVRACVVMLSIYIIAKFFGGNFQVEPFEAFVGLVLLLMPAAAVVNFVDKKFLKD